MKVTLESRILSSYAEIVALELWRLGAVKVNNDEPFQLVSGNFSPIYFNCRQLISSVEFVALFLAAARTLCLIRNITFDLFAGGETAGIPFAAFLAQAFSKPTIYVRKQTKDYGIKSRVEGVISSGSRVLLVEDLITDAGSKLSFINAIKDAGSSVNDVLVILDRQQGGGQALSGQGIRLHALTNLKILLGIGSRAGLLSRVALDIVSQYSRSPAEWHRYKGLPFKR